MRLHYLGLAIAVAAVALPAASFAQPHGTRGVPFAAGDPPEGYQPGLSAEAGRVCVKQCPNDQLPCDPPSFKVADGRCSVQWR